jgi:hypothetical protein
MSQTKHQFEFHDTVPYMASNYLGMEGGKGEIFLSVCKVRGLGLNTVCIKSTVQTIKHLSPATGNLQTMSFIHAAHSIG